MRTRVLVVAVGVVSMVASGAAVVAQSSRAASGSDTGRTLYREHCASCHGGDGRGDGPMTASLRERPTDLTGYARANGGVFPDERLRRVIDGRGVGAHGSVEMPVWGSVFKATAGGETAARARIDAIVGYLRALQERAGD